MSEINGRVNCWDLRERHCGIRDRVTRSAMALGAFNDKVTEVNGSSSSRRSSLELDLIEQSLDQF